MPEPAFAPISQPHHGNADDADVVADFVRSSARLLGLALDAAQIDRVAAHLTRTRALAAALQGIDLAPDDEPAELFRPAPFPASDPPAVRAA